MPPANPISNLDDLCRRLRQLPAADAAAAAAARARQDRLTKPTGALGRLEELAIWLAAWQGREPPVLERVAALVFAGNHGVAAEGVSAYPSAVTSQMVANFEAGGAAINQLCRTAGAALNVVPLDLERPTANFCTAPAMTEAECLDALNRGFSAVAPDLDLLALGEMGIANTTSAAAIWRRAVRRPGGLVDRTGHGPRCPRPRPQDGRGRARPRAPCRRARKTARDPAPARRPRDRRAGGRAPGGARASGPGAPRRLCRRRRGRGPPGARAFSPRPTSRPPTARPSPAMPACSSACACARCSSSTCAWAKPRAPRSRSCSAAPRSPATPAWRASRPPASAIGPGRSMLEVEPASGGRARPRRKLARARRRPGAQPAARPGPGSGRTCGSALPDATPT